MNKERLLNVAKALREAAHKERFTMKRYIHTCGTPGCAYGHYAGRPDLQDIIRISGQCIYYTKRDDAGDNVFADYDDKEICEHFGFTEDEARELFREDGCGGATTADEAADYIERFVATAAE